MISYKNLLKNPLNHLKAVSLEDLYLYVTLFHHFFLIMSNMAILLMALFPYYKFTYFF